MAKKDVVAQHHGRRAAGQKLFGQNKGLRQPIGAGLHLVVQRRCPTGCHRQSADELLLVMGRGDDR